MGVYYHNYIHPHIYSIIVKYRGSKRIETNTVENTRLTEKFAVSPLTALRLDMRVGKGVIEQFSHPPIAPE